MKETILTIIYCAFFLSVNAQVTISGQVADGKGRPIIGANVALLGTYDGTITQTDGSFTFFTTETGEATLVASFLGYRGAELRKPVRELSGVQLVLRESAMTLDAVEVSASTFKAGDNSKVAVMSPLDIVTTAGAMGDVIGALQTLPGNQNNPEDGRLFIRGGEARETNIYIDGLRVFAPFIRTNTGAPTRGRFSPFLFRGISFSTGGYSAAFGQALSGILDMNTIDEVEENETNLALMSVGLGAGHTHRWENQSLSFNANYIDLLPYAELDPTRTRWIDPYAGFSGEAVYRYKTRNGLLKTYISGESAGMELWEENLDNGADEQIRIRNRNLYFNTSYTQTLSDNTSLFAGLSSGMNLDKVELNGQSGQDKDLTGLHARLSLKTVISDGVVLDYGFDNLYQRDEISQQFGEEKEGREFSRRLAGGFLESHYFFNKNLAVKTGLRTEYHSALRRWSLDPRITIAQKLSKSNQVSAAFGRFTQESDPLFLVWQPELRQERATHLLVNFNHKSEKHLLRMESYYKRYDNLLTFADTADQFGAPANNGHGYAYGFDLFWRASQLIRNVDYWVSYSWLEHRRRYRDYPVEATPAYSTRHNLSVVTKIWLPKLRSQLGLSGNLISGRPYENPNTEGFLNERSALYRSISISWAYLLSPQKILFFSVSNAPGFRNEFGYEYGSMPNDLGFYPGRQLLPQQDRVFFAGFFVTISRDQTKNQLDNL